ncbi:hypothetical protein HOP50_19g83670 [Chloropicon primus]|uniref:SANTA domain-containing protein n=1 Tax=Chloropicon primus TaxID=1764295 RepID=A0A5B8N1R5_9CHLO|nr:hypothetical protein A3770_19p83430 [Chloropicon primus]UPR05020.1 hypothetical protein HOP50_19g83670 [Chloropicon primus]|mmetsp:Transcript_7624/g.21807  ORF Transcript_7624/g.21807 Transcript_7624/m.21807 type:complete len:639 (-) Transcript_7624:52-1968(-)|eukprot:QDZ25825.1 hypothetical protein A3770_19p83430 [Chloropicon primus]
MVMERRDPIADGSLFSPKRATAEGKDSKAGSTSSSSPLNASSIRSSFENLVRSSPLPKVLQSIQGAGQGERGREETSRSGSVVVAAPKAVRASLIPPPRFTEAEYSTQTNWLSPPKRKDLGDGQALVLFGDWWIAPTGQAASSGDGSRRYSLWGTEYSSFIDASDSLSSQVISRRLGSRLLATEGNEGGVMKVKLVGRVNEAEMRRSFGEKVVQDFAEGVPENWLDVLEADGAAAGGGGSPAPRVSRNEAREARGAMAEVDASNIELGEEDSETLSDDFRPPRRRAKGKRLSIKAEEDEATTSRGTPPARRGAKPKQRSKSPGGPSPPSSRRGRPGRPKKSPLAKFKEEEDAVVSTQAIGGFKTSSRGRRIVPRLDFWKNEGIKYDRGEVIGVKMKEESSAKELGKADEPKKRSRRKRRVEGAKARAHSKREDPSASEGEADGFAEGEADEGQGAADELLDSTRMDAADEGAGDPDDDGDWTPEQEAALSWAQLQVDPTSRNFWQEVAKSVPGNKTADECFQKHFQKHPTPVTRKTKSRTSGAAAGDDTVVANAPSAQIKKQMKKLKGGRWKRLKKAEDEPKESGEPDPMGMTQALLGGSSSQPKTLAAAIVSALAEAQPERDDNDEEEEDFYFDDDV